MTVRPIPCFEIVCDEPECTTKTGDLSEFSGWGDAGYAESEWVDGDNQRVEGKDGKPSLHYCYKHARPECVDCGAIEDLAEDEPDGDLYCPACTPKETINP